VTELYRISGYQSSKAGVPL